MANLKQSKKRIKQDKKKYLRNRRNVSRVKTFIKKFLVVLKSLDNKRLLNDYPILVSEIDKSVRRGVFHKNKANRLKSLFNKKIKIVLGV